MAARRRSKSKTTARKTTRPRNPKNQKNNLVLVIAAMVAVMAIVAVTVFVVLMLTMPGGQAPATPQTATPQTQPQPQPAPTPPPATTPAEPYIVAAGRSPISQPDEQLEQPIAPTRFLPENAPPAPNHAIAYTDAPQYLGQQVIVEGVILDGRVVSDGALNLLYFTKTQDESFYLAMFKSAYPAVEGVPSETLLNKKVRVTGPVTTHRGRPQIQINEPDQITILDTSAVAVKPASQPRPLEDVSSDDIDNTDDKPDVKAGEVSWEEAKNHVGQEITVVGKIVNTHNIGNLTFLNYDNNWRGKFYLVVYDDVYKDVPGGDPATYYKDKTLKVTGRVDLFESDRPGAVKRPQIKVRDVKQIQVVE